MMELSHSPNGMPDRRAASLAVSRASGLMPFTLHGTANFILTSTVEVDAQRAWIGSRGTGAHFGRKGRGPIRRPHPDFLPFAVNKRLKFAGSAGLSRRIFDFQARGWNREDALFAVSAQSMRALNSTVNRAGHNRAARNLNARSGRQGTSGRGET